MSCLCTRSSSSLGVLAGADIAHELDRVLGRGVAFAHQRRGRAHPEQAAVLADVAFLEIHELNFAVPQPIESADDARDILDAA